MEINLTKPQTDIFSCLDRWRVVVAGRRFGKSFLAAIELYRAATAKDDQQVWYVAPTYRMAKMIQWPMLKAIIPQHYIAKPNESELSITLINGSVITCKGCDNPDSLRGAGLHFLVMDEIQDIHIDAWTLVLMPACADNKAPVLFIGTPKGFNHFYDLWLKGGVDKGWRSFQYTTAEGGNVDEEELEMARRNMSPRQYAQEFEGSFETLSNRIFYSFSRKIHVTNQYDWNGKDKLLIGLDFNVAIMAGQVAYLDKDNNIRIFEEIALENSNTLEVAELIKMRYPDTEITIFPDPSGKSRKTSTLGGMTDHTILSEPKYGYNYKVVAPKRALSNADGFSNVNMAFMNANGDVSMTVHPRCKCTIKSCEGWTFKKGTELPDKDTDVDHHGDSLKYLVNAVKPVITNRARIVNIIGF